MRKATILATLALLLFSLTFAWGEGERVDAENVLKNASNSIVGISMSRSVGGNMQHSFGPGVFIEVDGDTTSHLLVQGSLWTTSASNPSFSVFLPTGVVTASLVKTDVENRFAIIKINKPYEDAKPVDFTGGKNLEVGDMAYVVYVLPQVLGLRPAIRTSKVTYISGRSRRDNGRMLQRAVRCQRTRSTGRVRRAGILPGRQPDWYDALRVGRERRGRHHIRKLVRGTAHTGPVPQEVGPEGPP
ncbi:MAG: hypothetical protein U5N86_00880 [Planctomycetota bacterium]|nr:hypothetical protein [Planctomycetota bacterium]